MTELKTLKDLPHYNFVGVGIETGVAIDTRDLRQEAIKWVKYYSNDYKDGTKMPYYLEYLVDWIKHFHNITEEDLK